MKRLAVVDTGPTPLGDVFGPPEDLQAYVLGALARGEQVDPTLVTLVVQWRLDTDQPPLSVADIERQQR